MRRIPVFATLVVLIAAGVMVSLGFWQLRRLQQKEALLARYVAAQNATDEVEWTSRKVSKDLFYRRAHLFCLKVVGRSSIAGRSAEGTPGMAQTADCALADGGKALVVLGWSDRPSAGRAWQGGEVRGTIAPGPRLVADPPLAGLHPNARPDPSEIPNNHLSYAIQWFLFAITALVIYGIALGKRLRG